MLGDILMQDPNRLREQARRCRVLAKTAIEPDVIEQLRVWSVELADEANAASDGLPPTKDLISWSSRLRKKSCVGFLGPINSAYSGNSAIYLVWYRYETDFFRSLLVTTDLPIEDRHGRLGHVAAGDRPG